MATKETCDRDWRLIIQGWSVILRSAVVALALCSFATSAVAQTQSRFDLHCTGTVQEQLNGPLAPYSQAFHIDLEAMEYCFDSCSRVLPITRVTSDRITFVDRSERSTRLEEMVSSEVNRVNGQYRNLWIQTRPLPTYREVVMQCEPGPFTAFPTRRF